MTWMQDGAAGAVLPSIRIDVVNCTERDVVDLF